MVEISVERLKELEEAEEKLNALEIGGVDNWDGYDFALEEIRKQKAEQKRLKGCLDKIVDEILDIISDGFNEPAGRGCGFGLTDEAQRKINDFIKTLPIDFDKYVGYGSGT